MRKLFLLNVFLLLIAVSVFADLKLLQPRTRDTLKRGTLYEIRWKAPVSQGEQLVTILIETADSTKHWLVDNSRKKKNQVFYWTVGQIQDGTILPAGQYKLSLEAGDDEITSGEFTIKFSPGKKIPELASLRNKIFIIPLLPPPPHCPECLHLDLREIKMVFGTPEDLLQLMLFKNDQLVAPLGQLGQGQNLPDFVSVKPIPSSLPLLNKIKGTNMEILLLNHKKEIIHTQQVQLKLTKARPTEKKVKNKKHDMRK